MGNTLWGDDDDYSNLVQRSGGTRRTQSLSKLSHMHISHGLHCWPRTQSSVSITRMFEEHMFEEHMFLKFSQLYFYSGINACL